MVTAATRVPTVSVPPATANPPTASWPAMASSGRATSAAHRKAMIRTLRSSVPRSWRAWTR